MGNLFSQGRETGRIAKHSGFSSTVLDSYSSAGALGQGLTFTGTHLLHCDGNVVYVHSGVTATITESFGLGSGGMREITMVAGNLWRTDNASQKILKQSGISTTIIDSFSAPANDPQGLEFDGSNLISASEATEKVYIHSGQTSTVTESFSTYGMKALAYDGANLISVSDSTDRIHLHSGITATITDSFDVPGKVSWSAYGLLDDSWWGASANQAPTAPTSLECEGATNALNVTDPTPEFTAIGNDPDTGDTLTDASIEVDDDSEFGSPIWQSGWIDIADFTEGNRCAAISYAGGALIAGIKYWWRITFKDIGGLEGAWSDGTDYFYLHSYGGGAVTFQDPGIL